MTTAETNVYVMALNIDEIFADLSYQRVLDVPRVRRIGDTWDRRLAGILEVSDRGENHTPRYAVLDGQHRWAAAKYLTEPPILVANVHEGLSLADEAALFDKLNRQRKQITTWDHWRARRTAGDQLVSSIEKTVTKHGLRISEQSGTDGVIACISTLEKIANSAQGFDLLDATLHLLITAWGTERGAYDAPIVAGLANVIAAFNERLDADRIIHAMAQIPPRRIGYQAKALRETTPGSMAKLAAIVMLNLYNKQPGPRLVFPPRWTGSLPKAKADRSCNSSRGNRVEVNH